MDEEYVSDDITEEEMLDIERIQEIVEKQQQKQNRIDRLEEIAHNNMSGEDIGIQLDDVDPKLRKEYEKLMHGWHSDWNG